MSGVAIDVNASTRSAENELAALNRQLKALTSSASSLTKSFDNIKLQNLTKLNNTTKDLGNSYKRTSKEASLFGVISTKSAAEATKATGGLISSLGKLAALYSTFVGVNYFADAGDDLIRLENKLRLVTDSFKEARDLNRELFLQSKETRTSLENSANIYFSIARSLNESGKGQVSSAKEFTKTISQSIAISGTSAQSANAALVQLSQGLASGTLRGEELNSVLEQIPRLGEVLRKETGLNVGALRKFAEEGKLTTDVVFNALKNQAEQVNKEFQQTTMLSAQGFEMLKSSIKRATGQLNQFFNSSQRTGNLFKNLSESIDFAAENTGTYISFFKQFTRNYVNDIRTMTASELAWRDLQRKEFEPAAILNLYQSYSNYKVIKDTIDQTTAAYENFKKSFKENVVNRFSEFADSVRPDLSFEDAFGAAALAVTQFIRVSNAAGYAISGLGSKLDLLIPDIRGPVVTLSGEFTKLKNNIVTQFNALTADTLRPLRRMVEGVYEVFNAFQSGDNELERAFVNVLRSGSINALVDNLYELGDAGRSFRFNSFSIIFNDIKASLRGANEDFREILIFFGLLENRLLFVNNIRFDRLVSLASTSFSVLKRIINDVLFPQFGPTVAAWKNTAIAAANAFGEAFRANINFEGGIAFGEGIVETIRSIAKTASSLFNDLFGGPKAASELFANLTQALLRGARILLISLIDLIKFFAGTFVGIWRELRRASLSDFEQMFLEITGLTRTNLDTVKKLIGDFGQYVKDVFYDVYDAVVGNSYWPDMIDGVNDYVSNLSVSESRIEEFKDKVKKAFKSMLALLDTGFKVAISIGSDINAELSKIEWGALGISVKNVLVAAVLSALAIGFGSPAIKGIGLAFFVNLIEGSLLNLNAISNFMEPVITQISAGLATIVEIIVKGTINSLDTLIALIPTFVNSFISGLSPMGAALGDIFSYLPDFNLLAAGLVGGLILAIKSGAPIGFVTEFLFGTTQQTKKQARDATKGFLYYIEAMFRDVSILQKKQPSILMTMLGNNPKLLFAGVVALASSALNSVSLLEASLFGVPMIVTAMLGPDRGGRALRTTAQVAFKIAKDVTDIVLNNTKVGSFLTSLFPSDSGAKAKGAAGSVVNAVKSSGITTAFTAIADVSKNVFKNIRENAVDYLNGSISIGDFFLRNKDSGDKLDIKKSLENVLDFDKIANFRDKGKMIGRDISAGVTKSFEVIGGASRSLRQKLSDTFSTISSLGANAFSTIASSFTFLSQGFQTYFAPFIAGLTTIRKFMLIIVPLAGLFAANMAFASDDTATFTTMVSDLTVKLIALSAAIYGIGIAATAWKRFKTARDEFAGNFDTNLRATTEFKDLFTSFKLREKLKKDSILSDQELATMASYSLVSASRREEMARKQGLNSVKQYFSELFATYKKGYNNIVGVTKAAVDKLSPVLKQTVLDPYWWVLLATSIENVPRKIGAFFSRLNTAIGASTVALLAFLTSLKALTFTAIVTWGKTFVELFRRFGLGMAVLASFGKTLGPILVKIGKFTALLLTIKGAAIALAAIGVGILGVMFFGRGDTFLEKLKFAKDELLGLVGFNPTSALARKDVLASMLPKTEIGDVAVDFSQQLNGIDFDLMAADRFEMLKTVGQTTADTIKRLDEVYKTQGALNIEQERELRDALRTYEGLLNRQEKVKETTVSQKVSALVTDIQFQDNSWQRGVGRLLERVMGSTIQSSLERSVNLSRDSIFSIAERISNWISNVFSADVIPDIREASLVDRILSSLERAAAKIEANGKALAKRVKKSITDIMFPPLSAEQLGEATYAQDITAKLIQYEEFLTDAQIAQFEKVRARYGAAAREYFDAVDRKPSGEGIKAYNDELNKLRGNMENARKEFTKVTESLADIAKRTSDIKAYTKFIDDLGKSLNDISGPSIGRLGKDFFGTSQDEQRLKTTVDTTLGLLKQLEAGVANAEEALDIKLGVKINTERTKKLVEDVNKRAFADSSLEFDISISNLELTKRQLSEFYAQGGADAEAFRQTLIAVDQQQQRISEMSSKKYGADEIAKAYAELEKLQSKLKEQAPKKNLVTSFMEDISSLGLEVPTADRLLRATSDSFLRIKSQIDAAKKAKESFDTAVVTNKTPDQQLKAFRDMRQTILDAERALNRMKLEDLNAGFDPTLSMSDRVNQQAKLTGNQLPAEIAANGRSAARWLANDQQIAKINAELSLGGLDDKTFKDLNRQLVRLERDQSRISELAQPRTPTSVWDQLSGIGAPGMEDFRFLQAGTKRRLIEDAREVERFNDRLSKGLVSQGEAERFGARLETIRKNAEKAFKELPQSISEQLSNFSDAGFDVPENKIGSVLNNTLAKTLLKEYETVMQQLSDRELPAAERKLALSRLEAVKRSIDNFNFDNKSFSEKLNDAIGASFDGVSLGDFGSLTSDIVNTAVRFKSELNTIARDLSNATSVEEFIRIRREQVKKELEANEAMRQAMLQSTDFGKKFTAMLKGTGVDVPRAVYSVTLKQYEEFLRIADEIRKLQLELTTTLSEADRIALNQRLMKLQEQLSKDVAKVDANKIKELSENYSKETRDALSEGLKSALKGEKSLKDSIKDMFMSFTDRIINAFVEGLMDPVTGEDGFLDKLFKDVFKNSFDVGGLLGGLFGDKEEGKKTDAKDSPLSTIFNDAFTYLGTIFDGFGSNFKEILSGFGEGFGSSLQSLLGGLFGGGGGGGGGTDWTSSLLRIGASFFGVPMFANGGHVRGPGTSTSDSILAMLSNDEFVVNAKSARKFMPLLKAINEGNVPKFAKGGLVGADISSEPVLQAYKVGNIQSSSPSRSSTKQEFNLNITGDVSMQTRQNILKMIPEIAQGVTKHNFERR